MSEELTYIMSLLSDQEGDAIRAIIAERDAEKQKSLEFKAALEDKLNQLETESHDATREFQNIVNELSELKAKNEWLRNEVVRLVETFQGMGSVLGPGRGYGSGAIATARKVLEETK